MTSGSRSHRPSQCSIKSRASSQPAPRASRSSRPKPWVSLHRVHRCAKQSRHCDRSFSFDRSKPIRFSDGSPRRRTFTTSAGWPSVASPGASSTTSTVVPRTNDRWPTTPTHSRERCSSLVCCATWPTSSRRHQYSEPRSRFRSPSHRRASRASPTLMENSPSHAPRPERISRTHSRRSARVPSKKSAR